jgi:hypothetical protein
MVGKTFGERNVRPLFSGSESFASSIGNHRARKEAIGGFVVT